MDLVTLLAFDFLLDFVFSKDIFEEALDEFPAECPLLLALSPSFPEKLPPALFFPDEE
jgi:hypothetical protein